MSESGEIVALREEIVRTIEGRGVELPPDFDEHTSLITSGLLDSTALFELALWVEDRVAPGLDLTTFDLTQEWDTVAKLASFIESHSATPTQAQSGAPPKEI